MSANRNYPPPPVERDSAVRDRARRRGTGTRPNRGGEWAWVVIAVTLLAVVVIASMSLVVLLQSAQTGIEVIPTAVAALPTAVDARADFSDLNVGAGMFEGETVTLDDGRSILLQPWNGTSRFTVLFMGIDRRPGESGLAYRTDTMMLISLDPANNSLGILSIPRDLYVEVPGYSQLQRINTPMVLGELQQPNYGPRLAMQTIQYNLGIRVHNYVVMDFQAVIDLVDLVGGIEIDVPYAIADYEYPDMNYGYDPLVLRPGLQTMDGRTALKYARTRHGDNDFQRARRQQQVLFALRERVLEGDTLAGLIVRSPSLLQSFGEHVYTDLTLEQMIQLALYLKDIPAENMSLGVIDEEYIQGYTTPQGASVLVPRRSMLATLLTEVFGANYSE